ncbi:MAG: hypothetical protein SVZ03_07000 [Spirochaetota bacterium]|nr:hypothetical protein [Spirochaetota bacterium]
MIIVKCIHCGQKVSEWAVECSNCGKPVANPHAPTKMSEPDWNPMRGDQYRKKNSMPFILTAIFALVTIATIIYLLKL